MQVVFLELFFFLFLIVTTSDYRELSPKGYLCSSLGVTWCMEGWTHWNWTTNWAVGWVLITRWLRDAVGERLIGQQGRNPLHGVEPAAVPSTGKVPAVKAQPRPLSYGRLTKAGNKRGVCWGICGSTHKTSINSTTAQALAMLKAGCKTPLQRLANM